VSYRNYCHRQQNQGQGAAIKVFSKFRVLMLRFKSFSVIVVLFMDYIVVVVVVVVADPGE
jgi:hypothetical protein